MTVQELIEDISRRFQSSAAEVVRVMRATIASMLDPIEATGEPYEWPTKFVDDLQWVSEPPKPNAVVDIVRAMEQFGRDAHTCAYLVSASDIDTNLRAHNCMLGWAKFFAVRAPERQHRALFASQVKRAERSRDRLARLAQEMLDRRRPNPELV